MNDRDRTPVVELRGIRKSFGNVVALHDASLELRSGEVHALIGENGAGKSTLIKVATGVHRPDGGEVLINGEPVVFQGTKDALVRGIAVIYQEPSLFDDLTVAENVFIGRQPLTRFGLLDRRRMIDDARTIFQKLGIDLEPGRDARGLSIADQQMIEIAKAISQDARVLIMDEPTAALSGVEVEKLFAVVRNLRLQGAAVLFISHRFDEIEALCERFTVMRDGAFVSSGLMRDVTVADLVRQMVGRDIDSLFPKMDVTPGDVVLEVDSISSHGVFENVSFTVRSGEIVALAGLVGAGRSEIVQAVFGTDPRSTGSVRVNGTEVRQGRPLEAVARGIAMVPEDRRQKGLILGQSILRNAAAVAQRAIARLGFVRPTQERAVASRWTGTLQTKYPSLDAPVGTLSGGNQQKVVLSKWLATAPKVLIIDEPTRGIDVGTKAEVHRLISQFALEGMAVVMVSSELPEVLGMADRVLVVREGMIAGELSRAEASQESIMMLATGQVAA